jgi:hypothetical protein
MAGAFVALDHADGFLPDSAGAAGLTQGSMLAVVVTRAAQGGKGPRVASAAWPEPVAGPPRLLRRGTNAIERLASLHVGAAVLVDDVALVPALRASLGARVSVAARVFDDAVEGAVAALSEAIVALPGGGRMHIEPTAALVAIDLDAGSATAERQAKRTAQREANRAALPVLGRQIRLRNLSGAILVDLAGLSIRKRQALSADVLAAIADDPLRPRFLGFTGLGLIEVMRPRVHPPLHELLAGAHAAGLVALRAAVGRVAADPGRRPVLRAAPGVVAALQADAIALRDLARRAGHALILRSDPTLPACAWSLEESDRA